MIISVDPMLLHTAFRQAAKEVGLTGNETIPAVSQAQDFLYRSFTDPYRFDFKSAKNLMMTNLKTAIPIGKKGEIEAVMDVASTLFVSLGLDYHLNALMKESESISAMENRALDWVSKLFAHSSGELVRYWEHTQFQDAVLIDSDGNMHDTLTPKIIREDSHDTRLAERLETIAHEPKRYVECTRVAVSLVGIKEELYSVLDN
ncbi:hypothetical protein GOV11_00365 [Candidatus Woesearchaeota archaeon]|nr:hypothetical protein [Candidatus Woesearchaeota archaeon]